MHLSGLGSRPCPLPEARGQSRRAVRQPPVLPRQSSPLPSENRVQGAADPLGILSVLQDCTQSFSSGRDVQLLVAQAFQSASPVQTLRNPRWLQDVLAGPDPLYRVRHLGRELQTHIWQSGPDDLDLARQVWMVDPVVEAAAFEGVMQFTGSVGGDHHHRRGCRPYLSVLGNGDSEGGQYLEQEGFELVVGSVDLIDQQYRIR